MPIDGTPLPGSSRDLPESAEVLGHDDRTDLVQVTLVLRRRKPLPEPAAGSEAVATVSREEFASRFGADPADLETVTQVVVRAGAKVVATDAASRRIQIAGTVATLERLFGATLHRARLTSQKPGATPRDARVRSGALSLPAELDGIVTAVLGLDDRPAARVHFRRRPVRRAAGGITYSPLDLARIYRMPKGTDGTGMTLAIIELGGGFRAADLRHYFSELGIAGPKVRAVGVDGASNTPGSNPDSADGEVVLDIEIAGGIAPGADQLVYFAPNTDAGFLDAISTATHATPTPTVISISWGQSEDTWTAQARIAMDDAFADAAALGITVTAAAGDNGSSDDPTVKRGAHVDFPASSPHVLACGGTSLHADPTTGEVTSETVWNDGPGRGATGGGISDVFGQPTWQSGAGVPTARRHTHGHPSGSAAGRGVPDVAANADPATGYRVYVDGTDAVFGGTSAVAPLWAGLVCRCAQSLGRPLGLLQPALYRGVVVGAAQPGFRDITSGSNGAYRAGPGWDPCTGLGVPDGTALLPVLAGPPG